MEKINITLVGDYDWKTCRDLLILKLDECESEKDFVSIMQKINLGIGTKKQLEKRRKNLGIHKFTKEDELKFNQIDNILHLIDTILRNHGKSNMIHKNELVELRNKIVDLQCKEDKNNQL